MKISGETTVEIARLDGGLIVLDGGALANAFFAADEGSVGGESAASPTDSTAVDVIEIRDVETLNRKMRARTPQGRWASITGRRLSWLGEIDPALDLIEAEVGEWEAADAERLIGAALAAVVGEGRGVSVSTKMLHLKRPRLFPMLDQLVIEMLGAGISPGAPADVRAHQATRLVVHLRDEGRHNLSALRAIQAQLEVGAAERSLVRILDAILWLSHPAAGSPGRPRVFGCRLADGRQV
jgi:hypothetical protein